MPEDGAKSPSMGRHAWRPDEAAQGSAAAKSSKRSKILSMLAAMLALAGVIAALIYFLTPFRPPFFVTYSVTEYEDLNIPPNPLAEQDSDALRANFPGAAVKEAVGSQQRNRLESVLTGIRSRADDAVIFHVRSHAIAPDAEVYLLPYDAMINDRNSWVPFSQVLTALAQCPAKHKLLILDVMIPLADPRLGVLRNDVATRIDAALRRSPERDFFVLSACGPGQVSLVSEDMRQSVFGYYLDQGLHGLADGYGGERVGRITVKELFEYVRLRVERWAAQNRATRQTPLLYEGGKNFSLVDVNSGKEPPVPQPAPLEARPAKIVDGWDLRDEWWSDETFRIAPLAYRQLEAYLLRAEQRWQAGVNSAAVEDKLADNIKDCEKLAEQARALARPVGPQRTRSLAAHRAELKIDPNLDKSLRDLLAMESAAVPVKPDDLEKAKETFREKFRGKAPYLELTTAVFDLAAEDPGWKRVRFLNDLLNKLSPQPRFIETLLLRRLATDRFAEERNWPTLTVKRLLQAVREGEAVMVGDPRELHWQEKTLDQAAQDRREGEKLLFKGRPKEWDRAATLFEQVAQAYKKIGRDVEALQHARRQYDRATALLPGFIPYLVARRQLDTLADRNWTGAIREVQALSAILPNSDPASIPVAGELMQHAEELQNYLGSLESPFQDHVARLINESRQGGVAELLEMQAMLESPCCSGSTREKLWRACRELGQHLHQGTLAQDGEDDKVRKTSFRPGAGIADPAEADLAPRRARLSIDLLKLAGHAQAQTLAQQAQGKPSSTADGTLDDLAGKLRDAWGDQYRVQLQGERDPVRRDKLVRFVNPYDGGVDPRSLDRTQKHPAAGLQRTAITAHWHWLSVYYESESRAFTGGDENRDYREFFDEAAEDYARVAR